MADPAKDSAPSLPYYLLEPPVRMFRIFRENRSHHPRLFLDRWSLQARVVRFLSKKSCVAQTAAQTVSLSSVQGVGKGTLIELLRKKFPTHFGFSVSHTTRNPREGEMNGVHYNFTTVDKMKKEIDDGKFVEYA